MHDSRLQAGAFGEEEKLFINRSRDMARRAAEKGFWIYGGFMSAGQLALLESDRELRGSFLSYGGYEDAERRVAAFGNEEMFGYSPDFPIELLEISCKSEKYAEALTHRDYLGSLIGLGISRDSLGDIILMGDCRAYLFCLERMSGYICDNLKKVRRTDVCVKKAKDAQSLDIKREYDSKEVVAASDRIDALAAGVFGLSRSEARSLAEKGLIFVDGIAVSDASFRPRQNSVISVRGSGKFVYRQICSSTGSGRVRVRVDIYK